MNIVRPQTVTIASGESLSGVVDLRGIHPVGAYQVVGFQMPSSWTSASVSFAVSSDGVTFVPLYWDGAEFVVNAGGGAVASGGVSVEPSAFAGWPFLKVRSGTAASAVNQAAERSVVVLTRVV